MVNTKAFLSHTVDKKCFNAYIHDCITEGVKIVLAGRIDLRDSSDYMALRIQYMGSGVFEASLADVPEDLDIYHQERGFFKSINGFIITVISADMFHMQGGCYNIKEVEFFADEELAYLRSQYDLWEVYHSMADN